MIPAFVNSLAGSGADAAAALRSVGGFDIRAVGPDALDGAVRRAVAGGARRVLIAGGDGSIGSAAGALVGTGVELAVLPCGTLNHFARDFGIPLDLYDAARLATAGLGVSVDAASVNDRAFLSTSSVGAYVAFVRARQRLEHRLGYHVASFIAGVRLAVHLPLFTVTLRVDGHAREYLTPLVFVGVGERELKLPSVGARVTDGRAGLHVMVVRSRSGARAIALGLAAAARGVRAVSQTPAMDSFLVNECRIEPPTNRLAVDGEIVTAHPPLSYRSLPRQLRVVLPPDRR